jgi:hypothetical protein
LLLPIVVLGAGPPEVIRVRVPSDSIVKWFPPGTELRGLSGERFETLVDSARDGLERQAKLAPPRLLQARHHARWEPTAGLLIGRSELAVDPSPGGAGALVLHPWTPAIEPGSTTAVVEALADGRTAVRVAGSAPTVVVVGWQLRARPGSRGCGFTLGLPTTETARLVLELPDGWVPEGPPGIRQGPEPIGDTKRKTWRFDGPGGPIDLQLRDQVEGNGSRRDAQVWVSGPTRIDLLESSANWTMDWTVDAGPRGPRRFVLELDAGLELIDVSGAGVDGYQAEPLGSGMRVTVGLEDAAAPTVVSVRAVTRVPSQGAWMVPSARPLGAVWTGGTTSVRLDASRTLEQCRERGGRRVPPPAGEPNDPRLLVFQAREPLPVAELVFRRPVVEASTEVRGRLLLASSAPRLECQITWRVQRGHLLGLEVDLPPTWVPDRMRIVGVDEPIDWHPESLPGGGVRVHVVPPAGAPDHAPLTLTVEAIATVAGGRGPLALPRVQPVGVRIADELWVAWTDPTLSLRPTSARGLAWIDPRLATTAGAGADSTRAEPDGLRGTLAWRWIASGPEAEARVVRERVETEASGTVDLRARVERTRARYDWQIGLQAGDDALDSIVVGSSRSSVDPGSWHFVDDASGLDLPARLIDSGRQAALGLPGTERVWELLLPHPRRGRVVVRARVEQPWTGRGSVPLLVLPERFHTRGTVVIEVERSFRSTVESTGLRALDPTVVSPPPSEGDSTPHASPAYRRAHAFGYTSAEGRLELRTESLEPAETAAVIREAVLTTTLNPQGTSRQHLTLRIATDQTQELKLQMPAAAKLTRVERDGLAIVPFRTGNGLSIPLVAPRGTRSYSTVTLDYRSDRESSTGEGPLHPLLPSVSLPCLAFGWEILAPEPWAVADNAPELLATNPRSMATGPVSWARGWASSWRMLLPLVRPGAVGTPEAGLLRSLDELVVATRPDEVTLGEWFTRWDSGLAPLVIDRAALAGAGWGPKSRVVPPQFTAPRPGAAQDTLRPLGLTIVPLAGTLLITTRREAPDRADGAPGDFPNRAEWEAAALDAVAWGYDRSDRFQSVTSWRGAATPKVSIRGETTESEPRLEGWRYWRLAAPAWPGTGASVHLINEQRRAAWAVIAGLAIVLAGVAGRRARARLRAMLLTLLLAATILTLLLCPMRMALVVSGALAGELGVVLLWLGATVPGRSRSRSRSGGHSREPSSTVSGRWVNPRATASVLLAAVTTGWVLSAASRLASAEREAGAPIIALLPYDGSPDPDRRPNRVILRRDDAQRLDALAALAATPPGSPPRILNATHRVTRRGERDIVVESEYLLGKEAGQVALWRFPVEDARDITATLDDRLVPVQVEPDGRNAAVVLEGPGSGGDPSRCLLTLRRIAGLRHGVTEDVLGLAINAVASARVAVEDILPDRPHIEVSSARGRIDPPDEGAGVTGLLGPTSRLEVRWSARADRGPPESAGAVEGLLLWDAEPAGDHVQARLTYRGTGGTSTIRLGVEPGVVLRAGNVAGLVDVAWQGSEERPEWVGSVDPPLADGATIQLEFWRPALGTATDVRALPRIEPLGVERYSGAVGFRRPARWSGRLVAGVGLDPMTDEAFVKAWGNLAEEPMTFAGSVRFPRRPAIVVATGPPASQLLVEPEVQLTIEPGRIAVNLAADLTTISGRCDHLELALPPSLELVTVDADGLGDWSRPTPTRLLLRFEGPLLHRRDVRIQAWLPVPADPLATGAANPEVDIPWPRCVDADVRPGQLTIVSPTRFQLVQSSGATPLGPAAGAGNRTVYRVDRPEALGRLTWEVEPPRLEILIQSQLTVLPDYAEWVAVLRYDVSGGGAEAVHLKLPTAWAGSARVQVVGDTHQLATEALGTNTYWMIRPDHTIWGSQRVIVRSAIPLPRSGTLAFPDLSPLGRGGAVDTYLALVNASGRELVTEGSPGLQPIADDSRFHADEFPATPGVSPSVYHVLREGWSLKVHGPGEPRSTGRLADEARVLLAELACTLRDDGAVVGLAVYEVEPRSGAFLALDPPTRSRPLWATVNNIPTPPLRAASGQWLIPIPPAEESAGPSQVPVQVRLIWESAPNPPAGEGADPHPLPLPALAQRNIPLFVTIHLPAAVDVTSPNGSLTLVPRERLEVARLEWQGRRITDALGKLDRSSQRECEALVSSLVQFELLKRDAERTAHWSQTSPHPYRDLRVARLEERVAIASRALSDALRNAALEEFAESARIHVGLVADDPTSSTLDIPEPNTNVRISRIGRPRFFQGESALKDRAPALTWTKVAERGLLDRPLDWALVLLGIIASTLAVAFAVTIAEPARWIGPPTLALALVGLAVAAGPLALAGGMGMAWLGWVARKS